MLFMFLHRHVITTCQQWARLLASLCVHLLPYKWSTVESRKVSYQKQIICQYSFQSNGTSICGGITIFGPEAHPGGLGAWLTLKMLALT